MVAQYRRQELPGKWPLTQETAGESMRWLDGQMVRDDGRCPWIASAPARGRLEIAY